MDLLLRSYGHSCRYALDFRGRTPRAFFWLALVGHILVQAVLDLLAGLFLPPLLPKLYTAFFLLAFASMAARRLRDARMPVWLLPLFFLPAAAQEFLLPPQSSLHRFFSPVVMLSGFFLFLGCCAPSRAPKHPSGRKAPPPPAGGKAAPEPHTFLPPELSRKPAVPPAPLTDSREDPRQTPDL